LDEILCLIKERRPFFFLSIFSPELLPLFLWIHSLLFPGFSLSFSKLSSLKHFSYIKFGIRACLIVFSNSKPDLPPASSPHHHKDLPSIQKSTSVFTKDPVYPTYSVYIWEKEIDQSKRKYLGSTENLEQRCLVPELRSSSWDFGAAAWIRRRGPRQGDFDVAASLGL